MFNFALFQRLVIATFGFDDFAGVRIFVDIHLAWLTAAGFELSSWNTTVAVLWME